LLQGFTVYNVFYLEEIPLTCLNGEEVDDDLINFSTNAKENMRIYTDSYENGIEFGKGNIKLQPIFTLKEDRLKFFDISK